jgi:hypothetical protein
LVELIEREVRELFGKIAPEPVPVRNPLAAYAVFAGKVMAWMDLMDTLLDDLRVVGFESEYAGVQVQAVVQLYERAMDRANTVLSSYARLKIDERLAAITSKQADAVIAALEAGLNAAGVRDPGQRTLAKSAASRELRAVR